MLVKGAPGLWDLWDDFNYNKADFKVYLFHRSFVFDIVLHWMDVVITKCHYAYIYIFGCLYVMYKMMPGLFLCDFVSHFDTQF